MVEAVDSLRMVPKSTYTRYKLFYNIHMVWMDRWILRHAELPPHMMTKIWECSWNPGLFLGIKRYHWAANEAADPHCMVLTSISNISKVFDNLDMMRMGRTTHHHAASTATVGTDWGSWLKSWIAAGHHAKLLCSGWVCRRTWNSYDVDGQKDPPPCRYHTTHDGPDFLGSHLKLKSWVAARKQTIPVCAGWGFCIIWNEYYLYFEHLQGVWQPSYDVDGQIDPSP